MTIKSFIVQAPLGGYSENFFRSKWHYKNLKSNQGILKVGVSLPLTSCLTGLESATSVWQLTTFVFIYQTDLFKHVKQEVNGTMILPPFSIPWSNITVSHKNNRAKFCEDPCGLDVWRNGSCQKLKNSYRLLHWDEAMLRPSMSTESKGDLDNKVFR
jgi:hypothetical protein